MVQDVDFCMDDKAAWERLYAKREFMRRDVDPEIAGHARLFQERRVRRVLDLGCGSGRHMVFMAKEGFEMYGLDIAPTGLCETLRVLAENDLLGHVVLHDMQQLPYDDGFFEAVISVRVIHHNRLKAIQETVSEIWRVLKPGGLVWVTVPIPKDAPGKGGQEIEPGTFVPQRGREKGIPHHHFTREGLLELFKGFKVIDLGVSDKTHHSLLAEKTHSH
jgi:SAM-dependent methyltransferase